MQESKKEVVPLANVFTPLPPYATRTRRAAQILYTVRLCLASGLWTNQKGQMSRMGKILEAFLTEQLRVDSGTERKSPQHKEVSDRGCELQEKLAERLNDEEKAILTQLVDTLFDESCYDAELKFQRGFRLGVLMVAEIFAEQDMFL
jgi:hypothetical protein